MPQMGPMSWFFFPVLLMFFVIVVMSIFNFVLFNEGEMLMKCMYVKVYEWYW